MLHFPSKAMDVVCVLPYHQARTFTTVVLPAHVFFPSFQLEVSLQKHHILSCFFTNFLQVPTSLSLVLFLDD